MNYSQIAGMGFVLVILALFTVVAVVMIWQGLKTQQIKTSSMAEVARDEAYRKLAEENISVQQKLTEDLSDLRNRVASIEKMLREVD